MLLRLKIIYAIQPISLHLYNVITTPSKATYTCSILKVNFVWCAAAVFPTLIHVMNTSIFTRFNTPGYVPFLDYVSVLPHQER